MKTGGTFSKKMATALLGYLRCPSTGRTIDYIPGDDKVICNCPAARERGGTHLVCECEKSSVDQWMVERGLTDRRVGE